MRRIAVVLFGCLFCAGSISARAQVEPTAYRSQLSLRVGGMGSGFQPDYAGGGIPEASPQRLYGFGVYADLKFTRWVQLEGEMRWLRMNSFADITQDNYLIGPRVPIHEFKWKQATPYGKALFGMRECLAEAKRRRIRVVALHASVKGQPVYEKLGFKTSNEMLYIADADAQ